LVVAWLGHSDLGRWTGWRWRLGACSLATIAALGVTVWLEVRQSAKLVVMRSRNFFGVLTLLKEDPSQASLYCLKLRNGSTTHGLQLLNPELAALPTTYFGENSGVGCALRSLSTTHRRLGIIGLGVGTLAAYAKSGD